MTTNFPKNLDDALMRCGRIDLDIELSNLDKHQANKMFMSFFNNEEYFELLWGNIQKYSVEPATLIQFLFNNRDEENITTKFEDFYKFLAKKYSNDKSDIYM
jgi:SpoVK/Ycf46/Vps4 family AAA+-type ATPase